jgi:hypothetical protein
MIFVQEKKYFKDFIKQIRRYTGLSTLRCLHTRVVLTCKQHLNIPKTQSFFIYRVKILPLFTSGCVVSKVGTFAKTIASECCQFLYYNLHIPVTLTFGSGQFGIFIQDHPRIYWLLRNVWNAKLSIQLQKSEVLTTVHTVYRTISPLLNDVIAANEPRPLWLWERGAGFGGGNRTVNNVQKFLQYLRLWIPTTTCLRVLSDPRGVPQQPDGGLHSRTRRRPSLWPHPPPSLCSTLQISSRTIDQKGRWTWSKFITLLISGTGEPTCSGDNME